MDRSFGTSFFLSDIYIAGEVLNYQGGSPVLFEHLFWFLGHPEVYIILLPALGITSEVIATNSRKPIFGYRAMIMSILAIAFTADGLAINKVVKVNTDPRNGFIPEINIWWPQTIVDKKAIAKIDIIIAR